MRLLFVIDEVKEGRRTRNAAVLFLPEGAGGVGAHRGGAGLVRREERIWEQRSVSIWERPIAA